MIHFGRKHTYEERLLSRFQRNGVDQILSHSLSVFGRAR